MKFLQKRQNERSFTKSDYVVLSYEQLLQVNGAGGSSSGGGGPSGPSGTSGDMSNVSNSKEKNNTSNSQTIYFDDNGNPSNNPYVVTGQNIGESSLTAKDILQPIAEDSIKNKDKYGPGNTCDEFDAHILSSGGYNPSDYCLGNTNEKVVEHISELKKTGNDYSSPMSDANIVFMGDGHNEITKNHEHAGMLFIENDGSVSFYHASSYNPGQYNIKETYPNIEAFEKDFGYDSFYYQSIQ